MKAFGDCTTFFEMVAWSKAIGAVQGSNTQDFNSIKDTFYEYKFLPFEFLPVGHGLNENWPVLLDSEVSGGHGRVVHGQSVVTINSANV